MTQWVFQVFVVIVYTLLFIWPLISYYFTQEPCINSTRSPPPWVGLWVLDWQGVWVYPAKVAWRGSLMLVGQTDKLYKMIYCVKLKRRKLYRVKAYLRGDFLRTALSSDIVRLFW